ncbi:MAG: hypothetical protein RIB98_17255 [Acidimicrobiales bacterium]
MLGIGAFNGILFLVSLAIVIGAVILALRDGERIWTLGMAIATAIYAPLGVVLAIIYVTQVRRS